MFLKNEHYLCSKFMLAEGRKLPPKEQGREKINPEPTELNL
jgi:hypothetical protein